ncbi:MAG: SpoIIE family protein phosphatase, partial [Anaerolineales bacterium]|nr:SpoIIE family protein phosphatase [Anaerolineales bacterium]
MEKRARILIVDDEPFNVDYIEQELEDLDYETLSAKDGREALDLVIQELPDVILLDIMMPGMDGFEVLKHLKSDKRLREIPVIVISALDDMDSVVRGIELGAEDYLPKPFDPVLLLARIGACLERKWLRERERRYLNQMEQELDLAWSVQAGLLPDRLEIPGWQFAARLKKSRYTSGDFFDLIPLPNGQVGILIADVADKGMAAALYMVLSRTLIRTHAIQYPHNPDQVLTATNQRLLTDINTGQFVTIFYGILDPTTGMMTYCNAGHNPPYHLKSQNGLPVGLLDKTGMALGVIEEESWERGTVEISPGDMLVLYTDGIIDAQNSRGKFFGEERLLPA